MEEIAQANLAPVVLFAYNRPTLLAKTLESLKNAHLSENSDVFIFIDGAKSTEEDVARVNAVKEIAEQFDIGKTKTIYSSSEHNGLAKSVVNGVTQIINLYGRVIVLEDDLFLSKGFLVYMNTMLQEYEKDNRIMQISGFGVKIKNPLCNQEVYLTRRAQSWGWATWENRWDTIDWKLKDYCLFLENKREKNEIKSLGSDLLQALKAYKEEQKDVWLIAYIYNMYRKKKYCICPVRSLVRNDGFGEDSSNCKNYNRYYIDFNEEKMEFLLQESLDFDENIEKQAVRYWTYRWRLFGFVMTKLSRIFGK
ncbi:MAG: glycosyltransferase [Bacteroidales bacterium]|nr:glycosyltransferase [Bacteroidales bacterium]